MSKRVVFAGGTQAKALAKAYRLDIALDSDEDVFFIGAESIGRDAAQKVVSAADVLVTDLTPAGPTVPEAMIAVGTLRIAMPVVTADFLWPYAAKAHPRNRYSSGLPDGPYPAGFGDSMLDLLAEEGVPEDEAIARYLAMDVAADAGLDRMLADALSVMRRLDAETGFDLADFVAANFRAGYLFAARDRLHMHLFRHIAGLLFGQMGISPSKVAQLSDSFFPAGAMPIHPAVLKHFGMTVPGEDHLYPLLDEGAFSFETYCRRYWHYSFNKLLHAAIAKAESNPSEAIPELRLALETSPESRSGHRALRDAERAVNDATMLPTLSIGAPQPAEKSSAGISSRTASPPDGVTEEPPDGADRPAAEASSGEAMLPHGDESADAEGSPAADTGFVPKSVFGSGLRRPDIAPLDDDEALLDGPAAFTDFSKRATPAPSAYLSPVSDDEEPGETADPVVRLPDNVGVPEPAQQGYEELPLAAFGEAAAFSPAPSAALSTPAPRYAPLPPSEHLIPLLPRLLPSGRNLINVAERPFTDMPETLPPPPLKPVLPPELHPEQEKVSLMGRILDQLRR